MQIFNDTDSSSYFGESSSYAISAPKNAGGYVGKLDIGSTASVGGGLKALGNKYKFGKYFYLR